MFFTAEQHNSRIRISETRSILSKALAAYRPDGLTEMEAVVAFTDEARFWMNEAWKTDTESSQAQTEGDQDAD